MNSRDKLFTQRSIQWNHSHRLSQTGTISALLILSILVVSLVPAVVAQRTVAFAGYTWTVKSGYGGPGSNYWSDSSESVWVDDNGQLHLKVRYENGVWYCSEVYLQKSLGYGKYIFHMATRPDLLKPMLVNGLFLYQRDQREVDIEFTKWGDPARTNNAQYVVSPSKQSGHMYRFPLSLGNDTSTHTIQWTSSTLQFQSYDGDNLVQDWTYSGSSTKALRLGQEILHINLWIYGSPPIGVSCEQEIIIADFDFIPT